MNFEHQAVIPEFIITLRHLLRTEAADWKNPLLAEHYFVQISVGQWSLLLDVL